MAFSEALHDVLNMDGMMLELACCLEPLSEFPLIVDKELTLYLHPKDERLLAPSVVKRLRARYFERTGITLIIIVRDLKKLKEAGDAM